MSKSVSDVVSSTQDALEKLVSDLRGLLSSKTLDSVPDIKMVRQRVDDGSSRVRDTTLQAAKEGARQARDAAQAGDQYAHGEPRRVAVAALATGAMVGLLGVATDLTALKRLES